MRNKPKEPPRVPKSAPFFLPTIPGLEPKFAPMEAEDRSEKVCLSLGKLIFPRTQICNYRDSTLLQISFSDLRLGRGVLCGPAVNVLAGCSGLLLFEVKLQFLLAFSLKIHRKFCQHFAFCLPGSARFLSTFMMTVLPLHLMWSLHFCFYILFIFYMIVTLCFPLKITITHIVQQI